jgi:hypothetical protein
MPKRSAREIFSWTVSPFVHFIVAVAEAASDQLTAVDVA